MAIEQIFITFQFAVTCHGHFTRVGIPVVQTRVGRQGHRAGLHLVAVSPCRSAHRQALQWLWYRYGLRQQIHTHNHTYSCARAFACACVQF